VQFPFVEDIMLGARSMREEGAWELWLKDKVDQGRGEEGGGMRANGQTRLFQAGGSTVHRTPQQHMRGEGRAGQLHSGSASVSSCSTSSAVLGQGAGAKSTSTQQTSAVTGSRL
jgi:hypothetical protein